jgi:hypothetical protein
MRRLGSILQDFAVTVGRPLRGPLQLRDTIFGTLAADLLLAAL